MATVLRQRYMDEDAAVLEDIGDLDDRDEACDDWERFSAMRRVPLVSSFKGRYLKKSRSPTVIEAAEKPGLFYVFASQEVRDEVFELYSLTQ